MSVLVIAEHDNQALKAATLNTVTAAQQLADKGAGDIVVLVAGAGCAAVAESAAKTTGVSKILVADDSSLEHGLAENLTAVIMSIAGDYSHILAPATTFGKNVMPRVAALLDVQQISEITAVEDADTFVRPIYAGNAMATVKLGSAKLGTPWVLVDGTLVGGGPPYTNLLDVVCESLRKAGGDVPKGCH